MTDPLHGFHPGAFRRVNEEPDVIFHDARPTPSLMDAGARTAITALYKTTLPESGTLLDLMCGTDSHLPDDASIESVTGLDVSSKALDANPALTTRIQQDLNENPTLPGEDASIDAVLLCNGLAYLTHPLEVLREAARLLRPTAPMIITFSDRFHPAKATALWQALEPEDRVRLTTILLTRAGFTDLDTGEVTPPEDLAAWQDTVRAVIGRAPVP